MTSTTFWVLAEAPQAAFKGLTGGSYRPSYPIMPPTAAWGMILNLARINTNRAMEGRNKLSSVKFDLPSGRVAIGVRYHPTKSTLYTQAHHYLVGSAGKELAAQCHGQKSWIAPVTREILIDLSMVIGVQCSTEIRSRVEAAISGDLKDPRFSIPFAGESGFMFSSLSLVDEPPMAFWYRPVLPGEDPQPGVCSLPVKVDFADSAKSCYRLFAPTENPMPAPPSGVWVDMSSS